MLQILSILQNFNFSFFDSVNLQKLSTTACYDFNLSRIVCSSGIQNRNNDLITLVLNMHIIYATVKSTGLFSYF